MSGRLLKKVLQEQEEEQRKSKLAAAKPESDESGDSPESAHRPTRNPFDLLDDQVR